MHYWDFSVTGALVEGFLIGLVFTLLAIVAIWATVELVRLVFPDMSSVEGSHPDGKNLPKVFRDRHATK